MKIENRLSENDFIRIKAALNDGSVDNIELLQEIDYGFVIVRPLRVSASDNGYVIHTKIFFDDPIGNTVCINTNTKEIGITKSTGQIELALRKTTVDEKKLENDMAYALALIERAVNYSCDIRSEDSFDSFVVDSTLVEKQIEKSKKDKERELRNEKIEPFAVVHADSGFDLRIQSQGLIPVYEEYDRFSLFSVKKAYRLLPRNFVMKLLKCEKNYLVPEEQFSQKEKEILDGFVKKRYIRRKSVAGKNYYFELEAKTRIYLIKALKGA